MQLLRLEKGYYLKNRISIDISPGAYIYAAAALLILPIPWFVAALFAAAVHESGHILALKLCEVKISKMTIGVGGAKILTAHLSTVEELICALSGPAVGMLAALLFGHFPRFAFCCFVQSVFNFLPFYPFDGGRVLRCIISFFRVDNFHQSAKL